MLAAGLSLGIWHLGAWQPLEQRGYNTLFLIRDKLSAIHWESPIVVVAIDEKSLQQYGQFPWSRKRYIQLLQALEKSPPAVIGFDILFIDKSPLDKAFAEAIGNNGKVVLAKARDGEEPVTVLAETAANFGSILHEPDSDGISRSAILFDGKKPSLSVAMLEVYNLYNPDKKIPIHQLISGTTQQKVLINWLEKIQDKPPVTYSFVDVVERRVPSHQLANKFVLVGLTATGQDRILTPLNIKVPTSGVYLHATMIDNLLHQRFLQTIPKWLEMLSLIVIGFLNSHLLSKQGVRNRIVISILVPLIWLVTAVSLFSFYRTIIFIAAPIGTMLFATLGMQLKEQYQKQELMSLFAKHVAPEMAELIWQNKADIFEKGELKAQEMPATVMFADIRGFTSISEQLTPRELLAWLNIYLEAMTDCVMSHSGVVDKYIGDAVMAVFGIPFPHTTSEEIRNDAKNAIAAAIAMHERLQELNQRFQAEGKPLIELGIGIHTGTVVAGSVGGHRRLNYSVVGDTVNVAARLEPMNKQVTVDNPYHMLVTDKTFGLVRDTYKGKLAGTIQLRGRVEETVVYSIISKRNSQNNAG
jgi:class 3 adenylate cyclase/CHASE2 domain-containing sensor protein